MLVDVVVDTNVLMHSRVSIPAGTVDPHGFLTGASQFVLTLENCCTEICVDTGGQILGEYADKMSPGKLGASILAKLAISKRIKFVPDQLSARQITRANIMNIVGRDRRFLAVATHSDEKVLVSHDRMHLLAHSRDIRNDFRVIVEEAHQCVVRLI